MTFGEQTLGGLYIAKDLASDLLKEASFRKKPLTLKEALFMQAASDILVSDDAFRLTQVSEINRVSYEQTRIIAYGFVKINILAQVGMSADFRPEVGRPAQMFAPNEIGERVIRLFNQD